VLLLLGLTEVDLAVVEVVVEVVDVEEEEVFSALVSSDSSVEVGSSTRLFPTRADPV